jgi:hypothetical protein
VESETNFYADHPWQVIFKALDKVVVRTAEEVNAELKATRGYKDDAYKVGTRAYEFISPVALEGRFVRVYDVGGDSQRAGRWLMETEAIAGLSPKEIAQKFSLPSVPTHVVDVHIPAGIRIRKGVPARVMEGKDARFSLFPKSRWPASTT